MKQILTSCVLVTSLTLLYANVNPGFAGPKNKKKKQQNVEAPVNRDSDIPQLLLLKDQQQEEFELKYLRVLEENITLDNPDMNLRALVKELEERMQMPIILDTSTLKEAGIDLIEPLPKEYLGKNITISQLLEIMKLTYKVSFVRKQGFVWVTTLTGARSNDCYNTKIIDITWCPLPVYKRIVPKGEYTNDPRMVGGGGFGSTGGGGGFFGGQEGNQSKEKDAGNSTKSEAIKIDPKLNPNINITTNQPIEFEKTEYIEEEYESPTELIDTIQVLHGQWEDIAGTGGTISFYKTPKGKYLFVKQNDETFQQIEKFLAKLKQLEEQKAKN